MTKTGTVLYRIISGYALAGRRLLAFGGIVALAAVLGFIIVWPVWFAAIHAPRLYSLVVIVLIPLAGGAYTLYKARGRGDIHPGHIILGFIKKFAIVLVCLFLFLTAVFLFLAGNISFGVVLSGVSLLVTGYFAYGRK